MTIKKSEDRQKLQANLLRRKIVDDQGCWLWSGATDSDGYGRIFAFGRNQTVSRIAAWLWLGLDLNDSESMSTHQCDNKRCFNPEHLRVGDNSSNQLERFEKHPKPWKDATHCVNGHEFSFLTTKRNSRGHRICLLCTREQDRLRYARSKENACQVS